MAIGLLLPAALPGTVSASNVSSSEHTTNKTQLEGVLTVKDVINEEYQKYIANTKGSLALKFLSFATSQALLAFANTRLSTSLSHADSLGLEFVPVTYVEENKNGHFIFWHMKKDKGYTDNA
ncbi:hypothetical protein [Brevibacillus laterosporus]|uniref:hypothetical protein n=1 Tax=Brevibacillus laterosporus TaxID=1465 RepID=UPI003D1FB060